MSNQTRAMQSVVDMAKVTGEFFTVMAVKAMVFEEMQLQERCATKYPEGKHDKMAAEFRRMHDDLAAFVDDGQENGKF